MYIRDLKKFKPESKKLHHLSILDDNATTEDLINAISKVEEIGRLYISMPKLDRIPQEILSINCYDINITAIKIESLDAWLKEGGFTYFNIHSRKLKRIDPLFWENTNMTHVSIASEELTEIQLPTNNVSGIQNLSLNCQSLKNPLDFSKCPDLYHLYIHCQDLTAPITGIEAAEKLSTLQIQAPLEKPLPSLTQNKGLSSVHLNKIESNTFTEDNILPAWVRSFSLENASIEKMPEFQPDSNLSSLTIRNIDLAFPDSFAHCRHMQYMILINMELPEIPSYFSRFSRLTNVNINNCKSDDLRLDPLMGNGGLYYLSVTGSGVKKLPDDWSGLKSLVTCNLNNNKKLVIDDFSFIDDLPALRNLSLSGADFEKYALMTNKKIPTYDLKMGRNGKANHSFLAFSSALKRSTLDEADKKILFDMVWDNNGFSKLPEMDLILLIKAYNVNNDDFKKVIEGKLRNIILGDKGLETFGKSSVLYVAGTTRLKKTEIKNKLEDLGISYSPRFSSKITHILIGRNPKNFNIFQGEKIPKLINENQLQTYFSKHDPQFLEEIGEETQSMGDNIRELLASPDSTNVLLGLEMLKTGGVRPEFCEELLVIAKSDENAKSRKLARTLLERYAPQRWKPLIADKLLFKGFHKKLKEQEANKKLHTIAKSTAPDLACILSIGLFKKFGKGLRYVFARQHKKSWKMKAYELVYNNGHFDFSKGMGYTNYKDKEPKDRHWQYYGGGSTKTFPKEALELGDITSINFHNSKLADLPKNTMLCKNLRSLDLSNNFFSSLPPRLEKLKYLEEIDLSCNKLKELPPFILKLKNLRKLDLRNNVNDTFGLPNKVELPEGFHEALPNCEVLISDAK